MGTSLFLCAEYMAPTKQGENMSDAATPRRPLSARRHVMSPADLPAGPNYCLSKEEVLQIAKDPKAFEAECARLHDARKKAESAMEFIEANALLTAVNKLKVDYAKAKEQLVDVELEQEQQLLTEQHKEQQEEM